MKYVCYFRFVEGYVKEKEITKNEDLCKGLSFPNMPPLFCHNLLIQTPILVIQKKKKRVNKDLQIWF